MNLPLILATVPGTAPPQQAGPPRAENAGPLRARRNFLLLAAFFTIRAFIAGVVTVHVLVLLRGLGLGAVAAVTAAALIGPGQVGARLLEWAFGRFLTPLATSWAGALLLPLGALLPLAGAPGRGCYPDLRDEQRRADDQPRHAAALSARARAAMRA